MENFDGYQIKSVLDYITLKDAVQEKLYKSGERWTKIMLEGIALSVLGIMMILGLCLLLILDDNDFPIVHVFVCIGMVLCAYFTLLGIITVRKGVKNLNISIETYYGDLRRVQEKLTYSEIYMEIPKEDLEEFDSIFKLISISLKRMKKST